jgi:hypothetical protein
LHPFTLCFYIRFGPYSFNYDVFFYLKSFIELICLWISFLDIFFIYQICSLFFWLLFLVVIILFLIEIVFQFHSLWFFSNLVLFLFKSTFFKSFFKFVFSCLFLIILVGLEFYFVIFLVCLLRFDPASWFVS